MFAAEENTSPEGNSEVMASTEGKSDPAGAEPRPKEKRVWQPRKNRQNSSTSKKEPYTEVSLSNPHDNRESLEPRSILIKEGFRRPVDEKYASKKYLDFLEGRDQSYKSPVGKKRLSGAGRNTKINNPPILAGKELSDQPDNSGENPSGMNVEVVPAIPGAHEDSQVLNFFQASDQEQSEESPGPIMQNGKKSAILQANARNQKPPSETHLGKRIPRTSGQNARGSQAAVERTSRNGRNNLEEHENTESPSEDRPAIPELTPDEILRTTDARDERAGHSSETNNMMAEETSSVDQGSGESASQERENSPIGHPVLGAITNVQSAPTGSIPGQLDELDMLDILAATPVTPAPTSKFERKKKPWTKGEHRGKQVPIVMARTNGGFTNFADDDSPNEDLDTTSDQRRGVADSSDQLIEPSRIGGVNSLLPVSPDVDDEPDQKEQQSASDDPGDVEDDDELESIKSDRSGAEEASADQDESGSEEESQDSNGGSKRTSNKGRTNEHRAYKIGRKGKKKGRPYKSDSLKINQALAKKSRDRKVIVQNPVHYPVESMNQLCSLLEENIEVMRSNQTETAFIAARERADAIIVNALLDMPLKWRQKIQEHVVRNTTNKDDIEAVKRRLEVAGRDMDQGDSKSEDAVLHILRNDVDRSDDEVPGVHSDTNRADRSSHEQSMYKKFVFELAGNLQSLLSSKAPALIHQQPNPHQVQSESPTLGGKLPEQPQVQTTKGRKPRGKKNPLMEQKPQVLDLKNDETQKLEMMQLEVQTEQQRAVEAALQDDRLHSPSLLRTDVDAIPLMHFGLRLKQSTNTVKLNGVNGDHSAPEGASVTDGKMLLEQHSPKHSNPEPDIALQNTINQPGPLKRSPNARHLVEPNGLGSHQSKFSSATKNFSLPIPPPKALPSPLDSSVVVPLPSAHSLQINPALTVRSAELAIQNSKTITETVQISVTSVVTHPKDTTASEQLTSHRQEGSLSEESAQTENIKPDQVSSSIAMHDELIDAQAAQPSNGILPQIPNPALPSYATGLPPREVPSSLNLPSLKPGITRSINSGSLQGRMHAHSDPPLVSETLDLDAMLGPQSLQDTGFPEG